MHSYQLTIDNNQLPDGYKQTKVGVIPEDWVTTKLKDIAPLQRGFDLPTSQLRRGKYPVVYSNGIMNYHAAFMASGPGVITGRSGTIGNVHYVLENYWLHNTALWVTSFNQNVPKYIYYLYQTVGLDKFGTGSGVPTLNRNDVHDQVVAIPPAQEQEAIARALSDVDALIASLDKLIAKKRDIATATMQQLLTGKKRLPGFSQGVGYKQTEVGVIPEDWDVFSIGDLFDISAGGDLVKSEYSEIQDDMYPYPIYANSVANGGLYGFSSVKKYEGQCITVTARGTLGVACFRADPFVAIGRLLVLVPNRELNGLMISRVINYRIEFANESTGVPQLTAPQIAKYLLATPPVTEQRAIAQVLSDMDAEIAALEGRRDKTKAIKQGMMQELLTGRTRLV